jgi:heme oxygenase (biliverdin-IX-beta and delta-forming)
MQNNIMMSAEEKQAMESFINNLRSSTAPMHSRLESTELSAVLMSEQVTTGNYRNYLTVFKEVIAFCENDIFPLITDVIKDTHNRVKLPLIQRDLESLPSSDEIKSFPFKPGHAEISTAYALGYMYVIEGSTLGGRVILKHLQPKIGVDKDKGAAFFAGYDENTGPMWKQFLMDFTSYVIANNCQEETIKGAQDAFDSIYQHFEKH